MDPNYYNGDEPDPYQGLIRCETCGEDCGSRPVCLPFGVFCSDVCADDAQAQFTERMRRRGFMEVQPDLLDNPFGD